MQKNTLKVAISATTAAALKPNRPMKNIKHVKKSTTLVSAMLAALFAGNAHSVKLDAGETEVDLSLSATIQPTYFDEFDFDKDITDGSTATSAGRVDVGDEHVRGEYRLGATVKRGKATGYLLLESDTFLDGGTADSDAINLERAVLNYEFNPAFILQAGHEFKVPDFAGGGLLYGDDHPILGAKGQIGSVGYDAYVILVNETDATQVGVDPGEQDSQVAFLHLTYDMGEAGTLSPIVAYHANQEVDADLTYFGGTYVGNLGGVTIKGEAFGGLGSYDSDAVAQRRNDDIEIFGANLTFEMTVTDAFKPNLGLRYTSGDDDPNDDTLQGWLGITDISGFVKPMSSGMGTMRWGPNQNAAFSTPVVFGSTFETSGPSGVDTNFGGIGNSGNGNNPGQIVIAPGFSGSITPRLSYMASLWFIWYDETGGLETLPGASDSVDSYAGTSLDTRLDYAVAENLTLSAGFSIIDPGDGVEDATGANDQAMTAITQAAWSF